MRLPLPRHSLVTLANRILYSHRRRQDSQRPAVPMNERNSYSVVSFFKENRSNLA